jgi:hypothetical protein
VGLSAEQLRNQVYLKSSSDVWRRSLFGPDTVMRGRAINHRLTAFVDRLRNENMGDYAKLRETRERGRAGDKTLDSEESQAVTGRTLASEERLGSHDGSTQDVKSRWSQDKSNTIPDYIRMFSPGVTISSPEVTQQLLRYQFRSCGSPEDFIRVFSALLDTRPGMPNCDGKGAKLLANDNIQRIISFNLARYDPGRALYSLSLLIRRLESNEQSVNVSIIRLAILSALRSQSLVAARRYIQMYSACETIDFNFFSQILSSMKDGLLKKPEGLRNTRGVLELLYQSPLGNPRIGKFCLQPYLEKYLDHQQYREWTIILGSCSATSQLRTEWTRLQDLCSRKSSQPTTADKYRRLIKRSPRFFMHAFFTAGSSADAWAIFETHGDTIAMTDETIWTLLMENAEEKPDLSETLQKSLEEKIKKKLERMLKDIETRMGIKWIQGKDGREGRHDIAADGAENAENGELIDVPDLGQDLKDFTRYAMEREDEIIAQKDDILAGKDPRPYSEPFS